MPHVSLRDMHLARFTTMVCTALQIQCLVLQHLPKPCHFMGMNTCDETRSDRGSVRRSALAGVQHGAAFDISNVVMNGSDRVCSAIILHGISKGFTMV